MKSSFSRFLVFAIAAILLSPPASAQVVEIPDPNLRQVIREALNLPSNAPITQQEMLKLTLLHAGGRGITDPTGLEYATNLWNLSLFKNQVQDITPLANLTNLTYLNLGLNRVENLEPLAGLIQLRTLDLLDNRVKDIAPIANLTNLRVLILAHNQVSDLTPLANLSNLEELYIRDNLVSDFTPLQGLNLIAFEYDEVCNMPPLPPPVRERIENRTFPSVVQAWDDVVDLDHPTQPWDDKWPERSALHDLHWGPFFWITSKWHTTLTEPTRGLATSVTVRNAHETRQRWLTQNPHQVFLAHILLHIHGSPEAFPPDSDFWLRDASGQILRNQFGEYLIDFLKPEVQNLLVQRILAIEQCGVYDGIFIDGFARNGIGFVGRDLHPANDQEIIQAILNIFRAVRAQARDNFLIIVNANDTKPTLYADFINGTFMETSKDYPGGYTRPRLIKLESVLSWAEEHLREPRINCLEGEGMSIEPPNGPNNLRWMRVFTTMSLTHSNGYVLYTTGFRDLEGPHHDHLWHDFWNANLGRPVGEKAQLYGDIEGLFIREFTNGWAVYNRSGAAQTITLPESAVPVSDRGNNAASLTHQLPDLDGEIYLSIKSFADVNGDGKVNILDLVQVANSFGKSTPDPNGDGTVNIFDLVFIVQQFSQ